MLFLIRSCARDTLECSHREPRRMALKAQVMSENKSILTSMLYFFETNTEVGFMFIILYLVYVHFLLGCIERSL